jgi:hypothetical protein
MMMLNVNHRLARANQEKTRVKRLYCETFSTEAPKLCEVTYNGLDMEEEHSDRVVTRFVQLEEVYKRVLTRGVRDRTEIQNQPTYH